MPAALIRHFSPNLFFKLSIALTQYPWEQMQACTIEKDFRQALEPTKAFMYEDLPALELSL
jgi:hypothetical protein